MNLSQTMMVAVTAAVLPFPTMAAPPVMRDVATHEQLSLALRKAEQTDPAKTFKATEGADPSVTNRPKDILADSDFISFNGNATLVPKRAIMQIPKGYADRIRMAPGAKLQSWSEFFAINRGWITTVEISRVQAEGNEPLPEETHKQLSKSGNLIVAVYKGGPISLLPLKTPEEPKAVKP